tara:strand:+ start:91 stop:399 length:309 start_codon:yes stop_codon:yes gene_type:complete
MIKKKKPMAARGKTTKRGQIKKMVKALELRADSPRLFKAGMSPGKLRAITGKTTMAAGRGTGRGALNSAVNKLVKAIKPDGKPTTLDFKKAAAMIRKQMKDM